MRRLAVAFAICIALSTQASAAERPAELEALLQKASDAFRRDSDPNAAMALFNQAVELFPEDGGARMQRAYFFEQMSRLADTDELRRKSKELALQDYAWIAKDDPASPLGGLARDSVRRVEGRELFQPASTSCPEDAVAAWQKGEVAFSGGRFQEALPHYDAATAACPANAGMWIAFGSTNLQLGDLDRAKEHLEKAVAADPWHAGGQRLLSSVERRRGEDEAAFRTAAWAVVADPESETSWALLQSAAEVTGREFHRVYEQKPAVEGGSKPGDIHITLAVGDEEEDERGSSSETGRKKSRAERKLDKAERKAKEEAKSKTGGVWLIYALTKGLALSGEAPEDGSPVPRTPLEVERKAVEGALLGVSELGAPAPFWQTMRRARDAGYLDEAIYLHLMDAPLADSYRTYRSANAERLHAYILAVLAPKSERPPEKVPALEGKG